MEKLITIGEVSNLTNISRFTLRFYEKEGLISSEDRTISNYRLFNKLKTLKTLEFIRKAQLVNFSLSEIKDLLGVQTPVHPCQKVRNILDNKITEINAKIQEFESMKEFLIFIKGKWANMPNCSSVDDSQDYSICKLIENIK